MRTLGPDTTLADVVASARGAGRALAVVPAGEDRARSVARFAEALHLPAWTGHNLDALAEALAARFRGRGPTDLVWDGTATLREGEPEAYAALLEVLADTEAELPHLHVTVVERL